MKQKRQMPAILHMMLRPLWAGVLYAAVSLFGPAHASGDATGERSVPYLTLRDRVDDDDGFYGAERSTLKAGWCTTDPVSLEFLSKASEIAPFRIPQEILTLETVEEAPVESVLTEFANASVGDPLLYIHGYYIDFEKGCSRATGFKKNAGLDGRFLWFSWPSDGSLVNYARDEVNLYWSVPDLAGILADLHDRFGSGRVDLAGHSLGGRGLVLALYEIAAVRPDMRFGEVVLLAPDMDFDIFRQLLPRVRPLARSITVYTSDADKALDLSAQLHGYPRLGESGNDLAGLEGVVFVDVSDLPITSANGHLYHIYTKEVGMDLQQLVKDNKSPEERRGLQKIGDTLWRLLPAK